MGGDPGVYEEREADFSLRCRTQPVSSHPMTMPTPTMKNMNNARDMASAQKRKRISSTAVF
jgi:hypothetical protein